MTPRRKSRKRSAAARSARPRQSTREAASTGAAPAAGDGPGKAAAPTTAGTGTTGGSGAGRGGSKSGRDPRRTTTATPPSGGGPRAARTAVGGGSAARTGPRSVALVAASAPTAIGAPTLTAPDVPLAVEAPTAPSPAPAFTPAPEREPTAEREPAAEPALEPAPAPELGPHEGESAAPVPAPLPVLDLGLPADATPGDAFDALYRHAAGALARQVELLTGDAARARKSVAHAYDLAWQRWPEVARDSDPVGWLRAAAYDHALAPWQRWVPEWAGGHRNGRRAPDDPLAAALLALPPTQRKALLLHDGLGLDLPAAAAEAEASEEAAAARIVAARETLTGAVPDLAEEVLPARLGALLDGGSGPDAGNASGSGGKASSSGSGTGAGPDTGAVSVAAAEPPDRPEGVRTASERGARHRTVGVYALTAAIAAATTVAVILTPAHQSPHRFPQSSPAAHAPARSGDRATGPAQRGGAGPLPSGKRTRAAVNH